MATAAITLGIVGLFSWIFPPLGVLICLAAIILSIIALVEKNVHKKRTVTGLITGSIGLILNVLVIVVLITAVGMLGIFGEFLEEFIQLYGMP